MENNQIFALDIGTRKVAGLVMEKGPEGYKILGAENIEHSTRAMMDGQIHDVEAVASTIALVKSALEEKLGISLEQAAVAAAGRALKTAQGNIARSRSFLSEITAEEVRALEIEAVQTAQYTLAQEETGSNDKNNYFCVGYSVVRYWLEDQEIGNLVGQIGNDVSLEVIATFLPRVVVDSLFSALKRAGLGVYSLTLEPIAALSVAIPPDMRLLNLALVDIGAGTSDIAVVKNGNIFAYAMVPMGGDEITELIAAQYLLDFNSAEKLKRSLSAQDKVTLTDILNNCLEIGTKEIKEGIQPLVKDLTAAISQNILELNQKKPDAVMCVGGGSLTPALIVELADALGMPGNRVGMKSRQNLTNIEGDFPFLTGPQGVTPLGIAYNSFDKPPIPLIKVTVNSREAALWNMGATDVMRALLSSGISLNNVYGKPGMGKTIEINGYLKVVKGEMGTAPVIKVNGEEASLETALQDGDQIDFYKGEDGADARITLRNLKLDSSQYVYVNGRKIESTLAIKVNDQELGLDQELPDRAKVVFNRHNRLDDILVRAGVDTHLLEETIYRYYLNEQEMMLRWTPIKTTVDGVEARLDQSVNSGSTIEYSLQSERPRIRDIIVDRGSTEYQVTVNGDLVKLKANNNNITVNGHQANLDEQIYNGARININNNEAACILSDIFRVVDINPASAAARSRLIIEVDGQPAGYTTPIYNNSNIKLVWE